MSIDHILASSRLRRLQLFIPPSSNPLLTTYLKSLNQKIIPLKQKFNVFSNLSIKQKQKPTQIMLNKKQISQVKRSYKALKNIQTKQIPYNQQEYMNDPSYKSLIKIRQKMSSKESNNYNIRQQSFKKQKYKFVDDSVIESQRMFLTQTLSPKIKQTMKVNQQIKCHKVQLRKNKNYYRNKKANTYFGCIQNDFSHQNERKRNIKNIKQKMDCVKYDFRSRAQSSGSLAKIT